MTRIVCILLFRRQSCQALLVLWEIISPGFMDASMALAAPTTADDNDYADHYFNFEPKP
jgi:hypothetical protein